LRGIITLILGLFTLGAFCNTQVDNPIFISDTSDYQLNYLNQSSLILSNEIVTPKHQKLKATLLTIFLGPFGVHRIYLGTSPNVPVVYSLTLGGLGILPLIDLISILGSKKLDRYKNNDRVIMWTQPVKTK